MTTRRYVSAGMALALASLTWGSVAAPAAQATSASPAPTTRAAPADDICLVLGVGSGAAGASKALSKGANVVGIGAAVGCWLYTEAQEVTPAEQRAAMEQSYNDYQAKSELGKLDALGYSCQVAGGNGGGDGTDSVQTKIGSRTITMKGVDYSCRQIRD